MNKPLDAQMTVLEAVLDWSIDRPAWQRDALRRIVAKGRLDQNDFKELVELCKQGCEAKEGDLKPAPLERANLPANPGHEAAVSLNAISDVAGVNNLAFGQTLSFEPNGITVIYGDNGAGKSGYARILKRACRARHPGQIESNVYDDQGPKQATAGLTFSIGGVPQPVERWYDSDQPHRVLSAVSVFDSECASVHIREKNEVAFRPFGLDVPDELANACQIVKEALADEQKVLAKTRNPVFVTPTWKPTTTVGKALSELQPDTDPKVLEALATLAPEEAARLDRLRDDLAKNPAKAAAEQTLKADNIKRLIGTVNAIAERTADRALSAVAIAVRDARAKRGAARLAADKGFAGELLAGVGSEPWRSLWESAKRYSTELAYPGRPFPPAEEGMHCVLCMQPLEAEARERMARFEEFIQKDTELQAQRAEQAAAIARKSVADLPVNTRQLRPFFDELGIHNTELQRRTRRFIASTRLRRYVLMTVLDTGQDLQPPPPAPCPVADLAQLEATVRSYAAELRLSAGADERKKLEAELAELSDRSLLASLIPTVTEEIRRLRTIRFLGECAADTTTNAITKLGNDIADRVITPKLRDRFQEEIIKLAAEKVRVEIVRSGGKYGSPQYQVRLFAKPDAKVQQILSEGEKTCVALAAFMTELATATHSSTLVFDDPVSSLDHRWRRQVAKRLVEESRGRQIIVFTHDLVFVNDLYDIATEKKRPVRMTTVSRGAEGAGIVADGLPWKAQSVEARIDKLEKAVRDAKKLHDNNQEDDYQPEIARIYNAIRASWERALEDIAFSRVVQRHRDYINTKDLKKVSVLTVADCESFNTGFKKCCDVVDAHDPSSGRNAVAPPPTEILQDIQALKDWIISLRDRQKKVA